MIPQIPPLLINRVLNTYLSSSEPIHATASFKLRISKVVINCVEPLPRIGELTNNWRSSSTAGFSLENSCGTIGLSNLTQLPDMHTSGSRQSASAVQFPRLIIGAIHRHITAKHIWVNDLRRRFFIRSPLYSGRYIKKEYFPVSSFYQEFSFIVNSADSTPKIMRSRTE